LPFGNPLAAAKAFDRRLLAVGKIGMARIPQWLAFLAIIAKT
jgi:hypothetical protein